MTAPTGDDALREALATVLFPHMHADDRTEARDPALAARLADTYAGKAADAVLPVVLRYGRDKAAEELETLAFRLVAQDVEDQAVYEEIGSLRDALTAEHPT